MPRVLLFTVFLLLLHSTVFAFDSKRDGFILGLGFGFNDNKVVVKTSGVSTDDRANGFTTVVKAGFGIDDSLMVFIERDDSFFYQTDGSEDVLWDSSLSGVGLKYFFKKDLTSAYFTATYGYGEQKALDEKGYDKYHGMAYKVGLGYQSKGHLGIEISGIRKELKKGGTTLTNESILITFNILLF